MSRRVTVIMRTDASVQIGTGHLMRCLTLAGELKEEGADVSFICRLLQGNLCDLIEKKGYKVYRLPYEQKGLADTDKYGNQPKWMGVNCETDAEQTIEILRKGRATDWLIVDHYAVDSRWEEQMRPYVNKVMVIDDIADRAHDCDLLLDQNLYDDLETRYKSLVPESCRKLLGPKYALLRPEFIEARKNLRKRDGDVKRILIFFGGSDPTNETEKALEAMRLLNRPGIAVDVIVGTSNPCKEGIERLCSSIPNVSYYCQVENMAELMEKADIAIGAGGSTTWERCCLALPAIIVAVAENQINISEAVSNAGAGIYLGTSDSVTKETIAQRISDVIKLPDVMISISQKAKSLVDGNGISCVLACMEL